MGKFNKYIDKYKKLPVQARASFWFLICSFLQKGISNLATPIFTRLMTTAEYGNYNSFNSWLTIVTIFVSLHLYSGVYTSGLVKFSEERNVFSSSLQGLSLFLTVTWTVIYFLFRSFWNKLFDLTTVQMLCMLVMIWATAAFNFWAAEQRVEYKYRSLVIVTLIVSICKPLVGVIFVSLANDKFTARVFGLALVELIGYTGLFIYQAVKGKKLYSKKYWIYALKFNIPLIPHYLSLTILNSSDRIMIKRMLGASEAGIYGLAYSISLIMTMFNTALTNTISPWMYQKIKKKELDQISSVAYFSLMAIAFINLMLILVAPEVIVIFGPKSYHEAIWIIPPVAISVYFMFMYDYFARFELYFEQTKLMMVASVIGATVNVVLNYIFLPKYGYIAAGYSTLICYIVYVFFHYTFMKKICREKLNNYHVYDERILILISSVFIILGLSMTLFYNKSFIIRYSLLMVFGLAVLIKRKKLMELIKKVYNLRKEGKKNG